MDAIVMAWFGGQKKCRADGGDDDDKVRTDVKVIKISGALHSSYVYLE